MSPSELESILDKIHERRNFDFRSYKRATLRRRIERRMQDRKCRSAADYLALLETEPDELQAVISTMLIKVTSFFRDQETWDELARTVVPRLVARKAAGEDLRIWSAGCATGEEAYSLAILLAETIGRGPGQFEIKIFGTDVDHAAIAAARHGVYSERQVEGLAPNLLDKWFQRSSEGYVVRQELRRLVVFGVNNLVADAPISRLDLLTCRNVFIYLDAPLQKRVLSRFHYALKAHGVLVLGRSELIQYASTLFEAVDLGRRIYVKDHRGEPTVSNQERLLGLLEQESVARASAQPSDQAAVVEQFHRDVLNGVEPALIATTTDGTVTLWNQAAATLWLRPEADVVGRKLASLEVAGLGGDLLIEKTRAVREGRVQRETAAGVVTRGGDSLVVNVTVTALRDAARDVYGLIYLVEDVTARQQLIDELESVKRERQHTAQELQSTNEELQSANEELETTNEELQSANEELQTTNEELQSTNEELETTNEELQSTNAELDATNRELAARTDELHLVSFYQRTIIRSLASGVAVLDVHGRVTLWNLAAERLLGLAENEAIGQLFWTLRVPALTRAVTARIRAALEKKLALRVDKLSYELPSGGRGSATLAAVPLLDGESALGAVIIFEDITRAVKLAEENATLRLPGGEPARPRRKRRPGAR